MQQQLQLLQQSQYYLSNHKQQQEKRFRTILQYHNTHQQYVNTDQTLKIPKYSPQQSSNPNSNPNQTPNPQSINRLSKRLLTKQLKHFQNPSQNTEDQIKKIINILIIKYKKNDIQFDKREKNDNFNINIKSSREMKSGGRVMEDGKEGKQSKKGKDIRTEKYMVRKNKINGKGNQQIDIKNEYDIDKDNINRDNYINMNNPQSTIKINLSNIQLKKHPNRNLPTSCLYIPIQRSPSSPTLTSSLNFSLIYSTYIPLLQILISFQINPSTSTLIFKSTLIHNHQILTLPSRQFMKIIFRQFMNHNVKFRQGSFYINPKQKTINFILSHHMTIDRIGLLLNQPKRFQIFIQQKLYVIFQRWHVCLHAFLLQSIGLNNKSKNTNQIISKKFENIKQRINKLSQLVKISHFDLKQLYIENISNKVMRFKQIGSEERKMKQYQSFEGEKKLEKNKINIEYPIIKVFSVLQENEKIECILFDKQQNMNENKQKRLHLQSTQIKQQNQRYPPPHPPHPPPQPPCTKKKQLQLIQTISTLNCKQYKSKYQIYSQIQIYENKSCQLIFTSTFSSIYLIEALCKRKTDQSSLQMKLIKKITKQEDRYRNQIQVLKLIKDQKCLFIPRYHFCQQKQYKNSIIMQYIPESTLTKYIAIRQKYISLMTKIFFLYEIIIALRFLRDNKIVHIDLKPQNILVKIVADSKQQQQHFIIKLIDFGQSYSSKIKNISSNTSSHYNHLHNTKYNRGYTIPYAPPQVIRHSSAFQQRTDVFSLGVIMYQILFEHFPLQLLKVGKQAFTLNPQTRQYKYLQYFSIPYEKLSNFSVENISLLLYYLCLKCLKPDFKERPTLDRLCVILKQIILIYEEYSK